MSEATQTPVVRRFILVALVAPAFLTIVAIALQLSWRHDLPDPIATHWGPLGAADGFGGLATILIVAAVLGLGLPALIAATTLPLLMRGARGANFRFMAALAVGLSALSAVLNTWTVDLQRGLADAHNAPSVFPALVAGFGAAAVAGVTGWLFQPRQQAVVPGLTHAVPLGLAPGERAVWMRTAAMARPFRILLFVIVAGLGLATAGLWIAGQTAAAWIYLGTTALVALAFAAATTFHVRVDETGVTAVSALGVPRFGVAIADVADAGVARVNGFAEFGGWGIRQRPGALGIILRNGESLQVTRRNGRRLVITVDDAETAAALLLAFAKRASTMPPAAP
ncbi:DUF1648 domain-containing protein [Demequina lutea]|uniref:DUF1648 domain-containing protein n=1 Tax=Demequina lutea TaxID=431489 RepID=A0A7Z0CL33_9MICO|nr:DUF1648 domain-containing protein [Demequina lutea]NYI42345.1 hypothetical protein [Demequina lutea]